VCACRCTKLTTTTPPGKSQGCDSSVLLTPHEIPAPWLTCKNAGDQHPKGHLWITRTTTCGLPGDARGPHELGSDPLGRSF
jgi:hypothetical protein